MTLVWMCIDREREFVSQIMMNYMTNHKTTLGYIISYTSEHNSIVKCCWRRLHTMKNFMLLNVKLSNWFWVKIMNTVNYLRNQLLTYDRTVTSEKVWTEQRSSLSHIRIFGSLLRSGVLAASIKPVRTSIRDWVKTLLTLTAVNILSDS